MRIDPHWRRAIVFLGILLLCSGIYFGIFEPTKILLIPALVFIAAFSRKKISGSAPRLWLSILFVFWSAWALLSIVWTPDQSRALRDIYVVTSGLAVAMAVAWLIPKTNLGILRVAWSAAVTITLPIALWELRTGGHLRTTGLAQAALDPTLGAVRFAAATFGNRNSYAEFLCLALPFFLWGIELKRGPFRRAFYTVLAASSVLLVLITGSRLGTASVLLEAFAWVAIPRRRVLSQVSAILLTASFIGGTFYAIFADSDFLFIRNRLLLALSTGDFIRVNLIKSGLQMLIDSNGLGVGAGGFPSAARHLQSAYPTAGIFVPHNLWVEIAATYGLLVFGIFVVYLSVCAATLWKGYRSAVAALEDSQKAYRCGLILLLALITTSAMNSTALTTMFWVLLGSIAAIAHAASFRKSSRRRGGKVDAVSPSPPTAALGQQPNAKVRYENRT